MTEKRKYEKPSMKAIVLQHRSHLLQGSNGDGGTNPYTPDDNDYNW